MDENKTATFLKNVDKETYDGILNLNQKLEGLLSELEVKIKLSEPASANDRTQVLNQHLATLYEEVKKALASIKTLVNLTIGSGDEGTKMANLSQHDLDAFREMIKDGSEKIEKIRDKF